MLKIKTIQGIILFIIGGTLGIYASSKNCLVALITRGEMNFWTGIEILAGIIATTGLVIFLTSKKR